MTTASPADRRLEYVPLDELTPATRNPKRHAEEAIGRSIDRFGYVEPVVVDERTGRLVAGHGRVTQLRAAREGGGSAPAGVTVGADGRWLVPTVRGWASVSDAEAEAYLAASNRLVELGGWDDAELGRLLADVTAVDADLAAIAGFDAAELSRLLEAAQGKPARNTDPDDAPPVPADPVSRPGDVWLLGPHRLVCGDSTDRAVLERLMAGEQAACVWTDPPYGVEYVGKTADALTIRNDGAAGLPDLLAAAFGAVSAVCAPGTAVYVAHPAGALSVTFGNAFLAAGWRLHQTLVWVKDRFALGHADYHYRHEPILYGYTPGDGRRGRGGAGWYGPNNVDSVFDVPRPSRSSEHPTMKPVALIERALENSTQHGALVLDPFGGSGSTLIACHTLGRRARLVELDPAYADVICHRYQQHTGTAPVLEATGEPHDFTQAPARAD